MPWRVRRLRGRNRSAAARRGDHEDHRYRRDDPARGPDGQPRGQAPAPGAAACAPFAAARRAWLILARSAGGAAPARRAGPVRSGGAALPGAPAGPGAPARSGASARSGGSARCGTPARCGASARCGTPANGGATARRRATAWRAVPVGLPEDRVGDRGQRIVRVELVGRDRRRRELAGAGWAASTGAAVAARALRIAAVPGSERARRVDRQCLVRGRREAAHRVAACLADHARAGQACRGPGVRALVVGGPAVPGRQLVSWPALAGLTGTVSGLLITGRRRAAVPVWPREPGSRLGVLAVSSGRSGVGSVPADGAGPRRGVAYPVRRGEQGSAAGARGRRWLLAGRPAMPFARRPARRSVTCIPHAAERTVMALPAESGSLDSRVGGMRRVPGPAGASVLNLWVF